jgi:hypothetical protein
MLNFAPQARILVAIEPIDFRSGIDRIAQICRSVMGENPMGGAVFVFRNRRRTAIRLLMHDGQGFWLCQKRSVNREADVVAVVVTTASDPGGARAAGLAVERQSGSGGHGG